MLWKFTKNLAPGAIVLTILCGLVYVVTQQQLRQGANDPQIELVRNMELELQPGTHIPADYNTTDIVDVRHSLSTFVMIFDQDGQVLASTGKLDDDTLVVPTDLLAYMNEHWDEHAVTLQPTPKVRLAAVFKTVTLNKPGLQTVTVMAARSLQEVEKREQQVVLLVTTAWGVGMILIIGWSALRVYLKRRGW